MKGFKLYTPGLLLEQDHHELEVVRVPHIFDHDPGVASIQQQLSKQLHLQESQNLLWETIIHLACIDE